MKKIRPKIRHSECFYAKSFYDELEISDDEAVKIHFKFFVPSKHYKLLSYEISGDKIKFTYEKLQNLKSYAV